MHSSSEKLTNQLRKSFETSNISERHSNASRILESVGSKNDLIEEALLRFLSGHETIVSSLDGDGHFLKFWESENWIIGTCPLWVSNGSYTCLRLNGSALVINDGIFSCLWKLIQQHVTSSESSRALQFFFIHSLNSNSPIYGNPDVCCRETMIYSYGDDFTYGDVTAIQKAYLDTLLPLLILQKEDNLNDTGSIRRLLLCMDSVKCLAPTGCKFSGKSCPYHVKDRQICDFVLAIKFYSQTIEEATTVLLPLMRHRSVLGLSTVTALACSKEDILVGEDARLGWNPDIMTDISSCNVQIVGGDNDDCGNVQMAMMECAICLDEETRVAIDVMNRSRDEKYNIKPIVRLVCSHEFHLCCIKKWAITWAQNSCPTCRNKLGHSEDGEFYFTSILCYIQ